MLNKEQILCVQKLIAIKRILLFIKQKKALIKFGLRTCCSKNLFLIVYTENISYYH